MKVIIYMLFALLLTQPICAQYIVADKDSLLAITTVEEADTNVKYFLVEEDYIDSLADYELRFGKNKNIPDTLKLPFYVALSHYPELYNAKIDVEGRIMFTTMQARPTYSSLFKKLNKRKYKIYINNRLGKYKGINLALLNFNSRVGFFGHELAHLLSYQWRNSVQLMGMGFKYIFSKKYKRKTERETDMVTIERGLGFSLYESKKVILKSTNTTINNEYRNNSRKNYMSDVEVLDHIVKLGFENMAKHKPTRY